MNNCARGVLCASLFFFLCGLGVVDAEQLVGLRWENPGQLRQLQERGLQVRYVDRGIVLVAWANDAAVDDPIFKDVRSPGERYYVADHLDALPLEGVRVVHERGGLRGWALVRMQPQRADQLRVEGGHFLWPLPERYNTRTWLQPRPGAKATQGEPVAAVRQLLDRIDAERLRRDVEALSLIDPQAGSVEGNFRTRFVLHPDMLEATQYIGAQLADALGEAAVEIQPFPISRSTARSRVRENKEGIDLVDSTAFNVVATLPGSDPTAGYYVICAHYDATAVRSSGWDWRQDPAPGADDNASGTALVLESARVLAGQTFPWTIKFIAFSGEELGLLGSRAYAEAALLNDERILGVLNFDMIGFNDLAERLELVSNPGSLWLVDAMRQVNERYEIGLQVDVLEDAGAGLSDHAPFWARGYDAVLGIENYLPTDTTTVGVRRGQYRINSQYHSTIDLPDSLNYGLMRRVTQLAVGTLAEYGVGQGLPNLAVFNGDLRGDDEDHLRVRVSNIGFGPLSADFDLRVSQCQLDSSGCELVHEASVVGGLVPGGNAEVRFAWSRFGQQLFLVEVEAGESEVTLQDNRLFQQVSLIPQRDIVVFPNPFLPLQQSALRFSGVPFNAEVRIYAPTGELVWSAREDDGRQRRLGARANEVLWLGVNGSGSSDLGAPLVASGIYVYAIYGADGALLRKDKVAVVRSQRDIVVFPNPFLPLQQSALRFSGVPFNAEVRIYAPTGELVWSAREDDGRQRRLGARANEVLWLGVNGSGSSDLGAPLVASGIYVYAIYGADGALLRKDKVAVVR